MSTAYETVDIASFRMKTIARPLGWGETREGALRRAARDVGLSYRQARRIIDKDVKAIAAHVWLRIEARFEALERRAEAIRAAEEATQRALKREIEDIEHAAYLDAVGGIPETAGQSARAPGEGDVDEG